MAIKQYLKYRLPYNLLITKLKQLHGIKQIIFHIDLASIARGLYNPTVMYMEVNQYIENRNNLPTILIDELRVFLNEIYNTFSKYYIVKFVIAIDSGKCLQTKSLSSDYKSDRSAKYSKILEDEEREIYKRIRQYYYTKIEEVIHRPNLCSVVYDRTYELDCLPYYTIQKNFSNSQHPSTVNFILSTDKDLLQTTQFDNTFQITSVYAKKQFQLNLWDKHDCIGYIYAKFLKGILTAEHVPLILAIGGDKADSIKGVPGFGPAHAVEIISKHGIPPIINESYSFPYKLDPYKKTIINNLKMTSFELQIRRIPDVDKNSIDNKLAIL